MFPVALLALAAAGCDRVGTDAPATATAVATVADPTSPAHGGDANALDGQRWYNQSCAACHGFVAQGMPHQGPSLRESAFIAEQTDDELVEFIKVGRLPSDPKSVMKLLMPPKGSNPSLTDRQIQQIVTYLRKVQVGQETASATME